MCTDVLEPRSRPSTRSAIDPATRSIPSSRAVARAQPSVGPSSGSAAAAVCSGVPSTGHFSGSTTRSAPARAAARVNRSAASRLRSRSGVDCSWTAAARISLPGLTDQSTGRAEYRAGMRPWRGSVGEAGRPEVPLPPDRMPVVRSGRPLKAWRWIGVFGPQVLLCAGSARVGPARLAWWAVWDREAGVLRQRAYRRTGPVDVGGAGSLSHLRLRADDVAIDLALEERAGVETVSPHGRSYIWTRKQGGVRAHGTVALGGRVRAIDAYGVVDDSAGYHARHTAWRWSAGVGVAACGARVAWNLIDGVHDAPEASERTVWIDGEPHEVGPVQFAPG